MSVEWIWNMMLAVLSAYLVFEYYKIFFKPEENSLKNKCIAVIYCVWQMLSLSGVTNLVPWCRLLFSILFVLLVGAAFAAPIAGNLIFAMIYNAMWMLTELLVGTVFLITGLDPMELELAGSVISKIALFLLIKGLGSFFKSKTMSILAWKESALLLLFPTGSMFFTYHLFSLSYQVGTATVNVISMAAFVTLLAANIVLFAVYGRLSASMELAQENAIFLQELDLCEAHMKEKEAAMQEFRRLRHDLKNQFVFLLELLKNKEYDTLRQNMEKLAEQGGLEGFTIVDSGNSFLDALINYKYEMAKQYGIDFTANLDIPTELPQSPTDLCVILGNALDNAIEANAGRDVPMPFIRLNIKYDRGNLLLVVHNSYDGTIFRDEKGRVRTRKEEKSHHGIGLISMEKVVKKYGGFLTTETEDKVYKLHILLHAERQQ